MTAPRAKTTALARQILEIARRDGLPAAARALAVGLLALIGNPVLFVFSVLALVLIPVGGLGFALFPVITTVVRWRVDLSRRLASASGVPIAAGLLYPVTDLLLSPMIAAAAMSLSSVSVITNALRLRRVDL